jgi:hypothetical protein
MNTEPVTLLSDRPFWVQTSVQQFLGSVNWDGIAQKPNSQSTKTIDFDIPELQRPDPNAPLSLSLTIGQFMTAVNWDGVAMIEVPSQPAVSSKSDESTLTLNDFSDFFE